MVCLLPFEKEIIYSKDDADGEQNKYAAVMLMCLSCSQKKPAEKLVKEM
jgi:hypothetical protein